MNLVLEAGMGISEVAADLDVGRSSLYNWVKQAEADRGNDSSCITTSEHEELKRLRRENRILKEERLILKKAAAFVCHDDARS